MEPFLQRLAALLVKHHRHEMDRIAVVLPGRRAGLHLRKYLAQTNGAALWSPDVLDMGAFMERCSGLSQGGSMEMLFLLYRTYRDLFGDKADDLAEFMEWAPVTLRDMSDVDAHLLDIEAFYRDLTEYHELDEWSFRLGELSPSQVRLNRQWRSTGDLHRAFAKVMLDGGMATSGSVARSAAERIARRAFDLPWKMVWFAGLNALDPASMAVIKALQERGLARLAWDTDPHYVDDPRQEAGRYLRRAMASLGPGELPPLPAIAQNERNIRTVATPNALAQTTYVAQRLSILSEVERAKTVVVLADETLVLPFLDQLPPDIGPLNVTMGAPLRALPVHGLTEAFLELHATMAPNGTCSLPALEALLGHPFLNEGSPTSRLVGALRELQRVRITPEELVDHAGAAGSAHASEMQVCLMPVGADAKELPSRMVALFTWAKRIAPQDRFVQEQLFQMARLQHRLDSTLQRVGPGTMDLRTYRSVRDKLLREEQLSFLGEPLRGLQVMGLLESRALDHERVIMVSVNEGVLPRANSHQSWIPFDIRRHHHLPMPADGEAITAYHFQRAMHLATEVEFVYNAGGDADSGERSRFIAQWEHEVVGRTRTHLTAHTVAATCIVRGSRTVVVEKDAAVMSRLKALCERGLSPSALGTWLRCPLDFHFRYVLGIRDTDVADGTLGSDVLGDAVHHVIQQLFDPIVGSRLTPALVDDMIPRVPDLLLARLSERFSRNSLDHGHFRLRREMAGTALQNHLSAERDRCKVSETKIVAIEHDVKAKLSNGVLLRGRCDRIDDRDGVTVVLDVKTGTVRAEDLRLAELSRISVGPRQRYALQLLIYAWAYLKQDTQLPSICAGVIPLQRASQATGEFLRIGQSVRIGRDQIDQIDGLLTGLVNELLDPAIPFMHDPESPWCSCCVA
ncbi:MAG TPA: PD-(D/E)XK nuclease family protein [Flavobacteriales bacterium]|nr:PD-(D/E)XK nuclease family protein [Flavobacteriales bacterium]